MKEKDMDDFWTVSASDMTGLTPTPARNDYEKQSYEDIIAYTPPLNPFPTFPVTDNPVGPANPQKFKEAFPDFAIPKTSDKKRV